MQDYIPELPAFDELKRLAKEDPEALEAIRQQHVEYIISNAPASEQARLKGLQFQIDAQRQIHHHSPMGSCMKISKMMHESFAELRGWLNQIADLNDPLRDLARETDQKHESKAANILAFPSA
jgi:hypothetical protein